MSFGPASSETLMQRLPGWTKMLWVNTTLSSQWQPPDIQQPCYCIDCVWRTNSSLSSKRKNVNFHTSHILFDFSMELTIYLTHWGRVTHICVSKLTILGSDNGLSPGRRQPIIWTNAGILLIGPLRTNFSEMLIEIHTFSFKKMHLKMSSGKWRPFCLGLNVLRFQSSPQSDSTQNILQTRSKPIYIVAHVLARCISDPVNRCLIVFCPWADFNWFHAQDSNKMQTFFRLTESYFKIDQRKQQRLLSGYSHLCSAGL